MASIKKPLEADNGLAVNNFLVIDASRTWVGSVIPIISGGTGAITAPQALTNLGAASLVSPIFTGNPQAPTLTITDNSSAIATTAFVHNFAPINSPHFTGSPTAPTLTITDNSSAIATTAFVHSLGSGLLVLIGDVTGSGSGIIGTTLADTGVATGTYKSVSIDSKGRIVSGTNPTTLAGYGITDAAPLNSPIFTGAPTASTPSASDNSSAIATTAWVKSQSYSSDSSAVHLTGTETITGTKTFSVSPTVPTLTITDNSTNVASTAYVQNQNYLTGNKTITLTGDVTGSGSTAIPTLLSVTGINSGTYKSVTIDSKGRAIAGTNPTTIAGYGITDAASLASPHFTGTPTAPTPLATDNSTAIATTAFCKTLSFAPINSPAFTGQVTIAELKQYSETINNLGAVSGNVTIDLSLGGIAVVTATNSITFTVINAASTSSSSFTLVLTNGGIGTITWMSGTKFPNGATPVLTNSGIDVLAFFTVNGGSNWLGNLALGNLV